jgi:hypothetical protein
MYRINHQMLHYISVSDDRRKGGVYCRMPREHFVIHVASSQRIAADASSSGLAYIRRETTYHAIVLTVLHHIPYYHGIGVQHAHTVAHIPFGAYRAVFEPITATQ